MDWLRASESRLRALWSILECEYPLLGAYRIDVRMNDV
jgi:hypothetical protein